jgi:2,3-bisphosphoglycerate-independent phosphoglycerate mutase
VLVTDRKELALRTPGRLADVAPTILDRMGIPRPKEMTGQSLLSGE